MTPDELRAAAVKLTSPWAEDDDAVYASTDDREWWSSLRKGRDAARRLADVIEWAASVPQVEKYPTFAAGWEEAALHVLDLARGETS